MRYPRVTRDLSANTAYVAFKSVGAGEAAETVPVKDKSGNEILAIDISSQGQVLGIEFLNAETQLPETLQE